MIHHFLSKFNDSKRIKWKWPWNWIREDCKAWNAAFVLNKSHSVCSIEDCKTHKMLQPMQELVAQCNCFYLVTREEIYSIRIYWYIECKIECSAIVYLFISLFLLRHPNLKRNNKYSIVKLYAYVTSCAKFPVLWRPRSKCFQMLCRN